MLSKAVSILQTLISMDTTSSKSNLPLVDWVEAYVAALGATAERFSCDSKAKAALWITFGPAARQGLVLSGHTDTVPAVESSWKSNPFRLHKRDDRLYGRGACDMKGFIAACLAALPRLARQELSFPIHLSLSYDEEVGIVGVRPMLREIATRPVKPFACIVGEPTMMQVVVGHKGKRAERVTVRGRGCHSSLAPHGVNAVLYAARLISHIDHLGRRLMRDGSQDALQTVPSVTVNVAPIRGGQWVAAVPDECSFDYEIRGSCQKEIDEFVHQVHAFAQDTLLREMQCIAPEAAIEFEFHTSYPAFNISPNASLVKSVQDLLDQRAVAKVPYGTEAGLFAAIADIPTVVVGPGSIEQAHKPNEFIEISQLEACVHFVDDLLSIATGQM
ncbi:acetylornithine deacetylase [Bradyrhizobium sp. USDA 326]|uniref:acetylornithine deacetylase n=1 Tax=Bradyrhizobium sp. USDA 326 TaxID=3377726 RepID=UPI003C78409A